MPPSDPGQSGTTGANRRLWLQGILLFALAQALLFAVTLDPGAGQLNDNDAYTHLYRAQDLWQDGQWFDPVLHRVNPPHGHVQHWTRAFDAVLAAGAWVGSWFGHPMQALYAWGVLVSPVLGAVAIGLLLWGITPYTARPEREIAVFAFTAQPALLLSFLVGRADQQSLLFALILLGLGAILHALQAPERRLWPILAGTTMGLGLWVSVETLLALAVLLATLGVQWLAGRDGALGTLRRFLGALFGATLLALLVEKGPAGLWQAANDQISATYLFLTGLLALGALALPHRPALPPHRRLLWAAAVSAALVAAQWLVFPSFFQGPLQQVTPYYRATRLVHIGELQPLWHGAWPVNLGRVLFWTGLTALGTATTLRQWWRAPLHPLWSMLSIGLLVFLPLGILEIRWLPYTALLALPGLGLLCNGAVEGLRGRLRRPLRTAAWPAVLVVTLLTPLVAGSQLLSPTPAGASEEKAACDLAPYLGQLNDPNGLGRRPRRILARPDYATQILYRTPHSVYAIPNHRPQPGYAAIGEILTAASPERARRLLRQWRVDLILICPSSEAMDLFAPGRDGPVFYDRLAAGPRPDWVRAIPPQGKGDTGFRLFRVLAAPAKDQGTRKGSSDP